MSCLLPGEAGASGCEAVDDVGALSDADSPVRHTGNPIDVLSGNKYQREIDFRALGSPLMFQRHYNSAHVDRDIGLGRGWRHSFLVQLDRLDDGRLRVTMADGREIVFEREVVDGDTGRERYRAGVVDGGYIDVGFRSAWYLPDGRVFRFQGGYLTGIAFPDGTSLSLRYRHGRLVSVVDTDGLSLGLQYVEGEAGLSSYGEVVDGALPGHLASVVLPGGERVSFRYDVSGNLVRVVADDDDQSSVYWYADDRWPSHLTGVGEAGGADESGRLVKSWSYDELGRGVVFRDRVNDIEVGVDYGDDGVLTSAEGVVSGLSRVTDGEGWVTEFRWRAEDASSVKRVVGSRTRECEACEWRVMYEASGDAVVGDGGDSGVARASLSAPLVVPGLAGEFVFRSTPLGGVLSNGEGVDIEVVTDRLGAVSDLRLGVLSLGELQRRWQAGSISPCGEGGDATHVQLAADGLAEPCMEDLVQLLDLADAVERAESGPHYRYRKKKPGAYRFCSLPTGRSCEELKRDAVMAMLSACVYEDKDCEQGWDRVWPQSLGLDESDFYNQRWGFFARLYQNRYTGEYVLAFRGTDQMRDVWETARQMNGKMAEQYQFASDLASAVEFATSGSEFSITGHSLGGGLATAAALTTGKQAIVFNAAALTESLAEKASLKIEKATEYVDNLVVDGDLLTTLQESETADFPNNDTSDKPTAYKHDNNTNWLPAPGNKIQLPRPSSYWIEQMQSQYSWPASMESVVLHRMFSVEYTIDEIIRMNCTHAVP